MRSPFILPALSGIVTLCILAGCSGGGGGGDDDDQPANRAPSATADLSAQLEYAITTGPAHGTVTFDGATATWE